jgi:hypothetical protein
MAIHVRKYRIYTIFRIFSSVRNVIIYVFV